MGHRAAHLVRLSADFLEEQRPDGWLSWSLTGRRWELAGRKECVRPRRRLSVFMQQPVGSRHPCSPAPKQRGVGERHSALAVAWRRVQGRILQGGA